MKKGDLADLVPVRDPQLRLVEFDFDVMELRGARTVADFPSVTTRRPSYIVAFKFTKDEQREPLFVDELTARILNLSDGRRSAADIARQLHRENGKSAKDDILKWIEQLFLRGLLGLQEVPETTEAGI
jgi:transposase